MVLSITFGIILNILFVQGSKKLSPPKCKNLKQIIRKFSCLLAPREYFMEYLPNGSYIEDNFTYSIFKHDLTNGKVTGERTCQKSELKVICNLGGEVQFHVWNVTFTIYKMKEIVAKCVTLYEDDENLYHPWRLLQFPKTKVPN